MSMAAKKHFTASNSEQTSTLSYSLFLYREELRRRNLHFLQLTRNKYTLTTTLISNNLRHLNIVPGHIVRNKEAMRVLKRGLIFRKELEGQLNRLHSLQQLGLRNVDPKATTTEL